MFDDGHLARRLDLAITARSSASSLVALASWSRVFNVNPRAEGANYYVVKSAAPSVLTSARYSSAYVVQDFDGNELNAPARVVSGAGSNTMLTSQAGPAGSSYDIWVGSSGIVAGASLVHTIPVVFDISGNWPPSPPPPQPPSPTPPPPTPFPPPPTPMPPPRPTPAGDHYCFTP